MSHAVSPRLTRLRSEDTAVWQEWHWAELSPTHLFPFTPTYITCVHHFHNLAAAASHGLYQDFCVDDSYDLHNDPRRLTPMLPPFYRLRNRVYRASGKLPKENTVWPEFLLCTPRSVAPSEEMWKVDVCMSVSHSLSVPTACHPHDPTPMKAYCGERFIISHSYPKENESQISGTYEFQWISIWLGLKKHFRLGMVAHAYNFITWQTEAVRSSRSSSAT